MKLQLIKLNLKLIFTKLTEFREYREIHSPKPEFEKLFSDFKYLVKILEESFPDYFPDITKDFDIQTKSHEKITGGYYNTYKSTALELLLFEVEKVLGYLTAMETEQSTDITPSNPFNTINQICSRFNSVVKQLRKRHDKRPTLNVNDEYDVQDLFHSILRLFFDDIRTETYIPEYAGANSRIDFLLKNESIGIEIKKTRETLKDKDLGEQLIVDIERYRSYHGIDTLFCFVYDPDSWINNPSGLEADLSKLYGSINVIVRIEPK